MILIQDPLYSEQDLRAAFPYNDGRLCQTWCMVECYIGSMRRIMDRRESVAWSIRINGGPAIPLKYIEGFEDDPRSIDEIIHQAVLQYYTIPENSTEFVGPCLTEDGIPDDTVLSWDEWNAKVDRVLREYRENI